MKRTALALLTLCLTAATVVAKVDARPDVGERAKGSAKVVLATVTDVEAAFGENAYGDRLILSQVTMRVEETMKGPHEAAVVVTLEGGTVGDLTLKVSDMPTLEKGKRAVLFLNSAPGGGYVPHGRGSGVVEVDATDRGVEEDLTVDNIRTAVKAAQAGGDR
jgi:hypothetical protein